MKTHDLTSPEQWLELYGDVLYRFALGRIRNPSVAEDLVQETLLAALNAKQSYAGTATTRTWLIGILKHKIIDFFRQQSRQKEDTLDDQGSEIEQLLFDDKGHWQQDVGNWPEPENAMQQDQFLAVLESCLDRLPEKQARLFILRELEDLDNDEICQLLAISSVNNLWVMMSRARLQLRQCIEVQWLKN